ncbi:beta-N-acetylhexosaminidase [Pararhizobium mangrovi]|uniref:beta-N-acetylhexosaminidase n=1 Tax=Pararhizobium mangrovi TaxID=2590452 RepID=A0A506UAF9_9HYPH|nr:beta-N-acetylhexosaminidase [Pararhizobium mangrovi]TPW29569.1 beta-N-acetylhexosaminidase [Pararhizobium mangrovi]
MSESKPVIFGCSGLKLDPEEIAFFAEHRPWGFILFARNVESIAQLRELTAALRETVGRADAPVLIDQEGGRVQRLRPPLAPRYPSGGELGAIHAADEDRGVRAAWLQSRLHAFDLSRCGVSVDCLPVLDLPAPGSSSVIGDRAYGTDPHTIIAMGQASAAGLKAGGLLPVVKHVPGHGRARVDTHLELAVVDASLEALRERDFAPFRAMNGEAMAMTAHVVYEAIDPENPATHSSRVVHDIIRAEIGFDGLLMSDDLSMKALLGGFGERASAVLSAGCDMVLHCNGDMGEMRAVADAISSLSGEAKRRADAVTSAFVPADDAREEALRGEFDALIGASGRGEG